MPRHVSSSTLMPGIEGTSPGERPDMNDQEREIITRFIERVSGAQTAPGTAVQTLPPVDRDADALIGQLFTRYPEARYRLTQTAYVQDYALAEAGKKIQALQQQVQQLQQQMQALQQQGGQPRGGFFSTLFGGGQPSAPQQPAFQAPPPQGYVQPGYAQPGYAQPPFQRGGSGFLGSALTTAAGVAGGMVVGNMLTGLFSSHEHADQGAGFGAGGDSGVWGTGGDAGGAAPGGNDWGNLQNDTGPDQGSWGDSGDSGWSDSGGGWDDL
ncbi:putative cytosolic protein [Granulibacter bethesdensis CGDNIH4]|nr:putative cytosolic protein [Granulibacter bethesdensis CGDNIH4]